jgi:hypothetical protein
MKHIVSLESEYELIYANAAKFAGISIDEILEIALAEYIQTIVKKEKALN